MEPSIIFQDRDIMVLDKPPGWVVNDADTTKHLQTVQSWLAKNFEYQISRNTDLRSGVVHRLDKDTSGVLLVAKSEASFLLLQKAFKERTVRKEYLALVHGMPKEPMGEITEPVGRLTWNRRKFGVIAGGREAYTSYKIIRAYSAEGDKYALFLCRPRTGRTHQIRVHLKHLGHAIVGDKTYAGRKTWRHDSAWCERIFLHAAKITFKHPMENKTVSFESPLPQDLSQALEHLDKMPA